MTTTDPITIPRPHALDLAELGTVLGVWAHPDDETYLTGGLMARLRDRGHRVHCVTATRGEAADPHADAEQRAALATLRSEELEDALALLGVAEHRWLDLPDGGCAGLDVEAPVALLARLIDEVRPTTVVTFGPDGFTGHPDHRAVSGWVDEAINRSTVTPRVLHPVAPETPVDPHLDDDFGVFELGRPRVCAPDEVAVLVPLDGAELDRKVAALVRQHSQTAALIEAVGIDRFRAWVATELLAEPTPRP